MASSLKDAGHDVSVNLTEQLGVSLCLKIAADDISACEFSAAEQTMAMKFQTDSRRRIWLRGRQALKAVLAELGESTNTEAVSFPHRRFSITHCGQLSVAIGLAEETRLDNGMIAGVGVDFELEDNIKPDRARFFLTEKEQHILRSSTVQQPAHDSLLRLWTAKEAIFKSDPQNGARDLIDYEFDDPQLWNGSATARSQQSFSVRYTSMRWRGGIISAAVSTNVLD